MLDFQSDFLKITSESLHQVSAFRGTTLGRHADFGRLVVVPLPIACTKRQKPRVLQAITA
jgi:hypothetical protein